jgi:hypothetical protein
MIVCRVSELRAQMKAGDMNAHRTVYIPSLRQSALRHCRIE